MRAARAWRIAAALLLLTGLAGAAAGLWLLTTNQALDWVVAEAIRRSNGALAVEGAQGTLFGPIKAKRIVYETGSVRVVAEDAAVEASVRALTRRQLAIRSLEAGFLLVEVKPSSEPARPPDSAALPLPVSIGRIAVRAAQLQGHRIGGLSLSYEGGAEEHVVRALKAETQAGSVEIDAWMAARYPFALSGRAQLTGKAAQAGWSATAVVSGNLLETRVEATTAARGARAQGSVRIAPFEERWLESFEVTAEDVDLAAFDAKLPRSLLRIEASGSGAAGALAEGRVQVANQRAGTFTAGRIPLVSLSAGYKLRNRGIDLSQLRASLGAGGQLAGSASVEPGEGSVNLDVKALDLRSLHAPLRATQLNGSVRARIREDEQQVHARLSERGIAFTVDASRRGEAISVKELHATAGGGELRGSGSLSLARPRRFAATATLARLDASKFGDYPRSDLNGVLKLEGSLLPEWRAGVTLDVRRSEIRGVRLEGSVAGEVSAHGARDLAVNLAAGANTLRAAGSIGRSEDRLTFTLDAKRVADLDPRLTGALAASGGLTGTLAQPGMSIELKGKALGLKDGRVLETLNARLSGTAARHVLEVQARMSPFDLTGSAEGRWEAQAGWSGIVSSFENKGAYPASLAQPMPVRAGKGQVAAGPAQLRVAGGQATLETLSWANGRLETRGQLADLPVAPFLVLAGLPASPTDLRVQGQWALAATPRLNGTVTLARQSGDIVVPGATPFALRLERLQLEARATDDAVQGTLDAAAPSLNGQLRFAVASLTRKAALKLEGSFAAESLRPLAPLFGTYVAVDGRANLSVTADGTLDAPRPAGTLVATNLRLEAPQYGVSLREGTMRAELGETELKLTEFAFRGGEGRLTATGVMPRAAKSGASLTWRAENLQIFDRPDMRLRMDGAGTVGFVQDKLQLRGTLTAQQGYFEFDRARAPRLGDDVVVIGRPRPAAPATARGRFEAKLLDLDVQLDFGNRMRIVGAGIDTGVVGKLRLHTTKQGLIEAHGTLASVQGVYYAFGQRLEIERGRLLFDGPPDNPALDILAKRKHLQVEAGVEVTGTVQVPRVQLVSQPPVADSEKLAWLTMGRPLHEVSPTDAALLQAAASALTSGGSAIPLSRKIAGQIGLDDVAVRGGGVPGTQVVALGKRFSDKLYIEYQQGMAATSALLRLSYTLTRAISLRLEAGALSSVGVYYNRSYE